MRKRGRKLDKETSCGKMASCQEELSPLADTKRPTSSTSRGQKLENKLSRQVFRTGHRLERKELWNHHSPKSSKAVFAIIKFPRRQDNWRVTDHCQYWKRNTNCQWGTRNLHRNSDCTIANLEMKNWLRQPITSNSGENSKLIVRRRWRLGQSRANAKSYEHWSRFHQEMQSRF